jgi:hypothetical protein
MSDSSLAESSADPYEQSMVNPSQLFERSQDQMRGLPVELEEQLNVCRLLIYRN